MAAGRRAAVGFAIAICGLLVAPASAATRVDTDAYTPTLPAGHCLQTTKNRPSVWLESSSQRFQLTVFADGQLSLTNNVVVDGEGDGYPTWYAYVPSHSGHRASLCMTRTGNLVLRKNSHIVWTSGTTGTATDGRAHLTNGGRLVVETATGRVVWSSKTTAVFLIRGDQLQSGATLVNRTYPGSITRLQMSKGGNLILRRNHDPVWQTNTHVAGSRLLITQTGRIAIRSPHGRTLWRSPAAGRNVVMEVAQSGRLLLQHIGGIHCWVRPAGSDPDCSG